ESANGNRIHQDRNVRGAEARMDARKEPREIALLGEGKSNACGMEKIGAQVPVGGNQSTEADGRRSPVAEKVARGVCERSRRCSSVRQRAHHYIHNAGVEENLKQ